MKKQFPIARQAVIEMNLPIIQRAGVEADDMIAAYAKLAAAQGHRVIVVSPDKDMIQLLDKEQNIVVYDPSKKAYITSEDVVAKYGVQPQQFLDLQALMGDKVDNIPNVPGVGVKTAAKLITEYGNVQNMLEKLNDEKLRKKMAEFKDQILRSYQLAQFHAVSDIDVKDIEKKAMDLAQVCICCIGLFCRSRHFLTSMNSIPFPRRC